MICELNELLKNIKNLVNSVEPLDNASRFGNPAFQTLFNLIKQVQIQV